MNWIKTGLVLAVLGLAGCEVPKLDTTYVSTTPADTRRFALAQRAVRACIGVADKAKVARNFRRAGFGVTETEVAVRGGRKVPRVLIKAPDEAVSVLLAGNDCYVGLENMTPAQSAQLAQIWVRAYGAAPNAAHGDGLSDHVSGAWRRFFTEPARIPNKAAYGHRIYISAFKSWPSGPYDPQKGVGYDISGIFPNVPGAAVRLTHVRQCQPHVKLDSKRGAFLPCSGSTFHPR